MKRGVWRSNLHEDNNAVTAHERPERHGAYREVHFTFGLENSVQRKKEEERAHGQIELECATLKAEAATEEGF